MSNFFAAAAKTNTLPSQQIQTRTAFFCSNIRKFPQKYSVEVNIIYPLAYKSDTRMLLREFKNRCTQQQNCNLEMVVFGDVG